MCVLDCSVDTKLNLPVYFSDASSFLMQIREIASRKCILAQLYFYLQHVATLPSKPKEDAVTALLKKVVELLQKLPKGKEFVDYLQKHQNREKLWIQWKEKKYPEMVPKTELPEHKVNSISLAACVPGDRRLLCRQSGLDRAVGSFKGSSL